MNLKKMRKRTWMILAGILLIFCVGVMGWHWKHTIPVRSRLPVLMYHHVVENDQPCNDMTITVERLEKDLQWLSQHGYHSVLPRELHEGEALPEKSVLITFDDGYRSNYELLYPLLQKYQTKAVISNIVLMQDIGASNFISWEMCREMVDSGLVEIGSHTYKLHNLGELGGSFNHDGINGIQRDPSETEVEFQERVLGDIQRSYDLITQEIGQAPTFFAYPFGIQEPDAEELIQQLFSVTAVTQDGIGDLRKGLYNLPRMTVTMEKELYTILEE